MPVWPSKPKESASPPPPHLEKPEVPVQEELVQEIAPHEEPEPAPVQSEWQRCLYLKTDIVGWVIGMSNIAVEVDLAPHLSLSVPVYYSGWNYFCYKSKFRVLGTQPELRYWFGEQDGWFIGAHFGVSSFNFATGGDYRIQDKDGKTPALGGGVGGGYRLPLGRSGRWKLDFALGLGAYRVEYDKYANEKNGPKLETVKKTYFGPDAAAVSVAYSFGIRTARRTAK